MNLNFKMSELIYSDTAIKHSINNMADINCLDNLLDLIFHCLQPIRNKINKPMIVTSGYRCPEVNKLVKGKPDSQHLKGQAVDFKIKGMTTKEIIDFIKKSNIEFDQLIDEKDWVHISFNKNKNRRQVINL